MTTDAIEANTICSIFTSCKSDQETLADDKSFSNFKGLMPSSPLPVRSMF